MFTPADRERIRAAIIERARDDRRITGVAITGSASVGREDAWSDIDLGFGVASALAGWLWQYVGPSATFYTGAGLTAIALVVLRLRGGDVGKLATAA